MTALRRTWIYGASACIAFAIVYFLFLSNPSRGLRSPDNLIKTIAEDNELLRDFLFHDSLGNIRQLITNADERILISLDSLCIVECSRHDNSCYMEMQESGYNMAVIDQSFQGRFRPEPIQLSPELREGGVWHISYGVVPEMLARLDRCYVELPYLKTMIEVFRSRKSTPREATTGDLDVNTYFGMERQFAISDCKVDSLTVADSSAIGVISGVFGGEASKIVVQIKKVEGLWFLDLPFCDDMAAVRSIRESKSAAPGTSLRYEMKTVDEWIDIGKDVSPSVKHQAILALTHAWNASGDTKFMSAIIEIMQRVTTPTWIETLKEIANGNRWLEPTQMELLINVVCKLLHREFSAEIPLSKSSAEYVERALKSLDLLLSHYPVVRGNAINHLSWLSGGDAASDFSYLLRDKHSLRYSGAAASACVERIRRALERTENWCLGEFGMFSVLGELAESGDSQAIELLVENVYNKSLRERKESAVGGRRIENEECCVERTRNAIIRIRSLYNPSMDKSIRSAAAEVMWMHWNSIAEEMARQLGAAQDAIRSVKHPGDVARAEESFRSRVEFFDGFKSIIRPYMPNEFDSVGVRDGKSLPNPGTPEDSIVDPASDDVSSRLLAWPFDEEAAKAGQSAWAKRLKKRVVERSGNGMELVVIPPGTFMMGSPAGEDGHQDDENLVSVTLTSAFQMSRTEVTQGQWMAVMGTAPWKGQEFVREGEDYAATHVSWGDAVAFCEKLSSSEGVAYRLPTEAEWEWACRGGSDSAFSFGRDERELDRYAWFDRNAWDFREKWAHRVGQRLPNSFGLSDMHGNVWEWCGDWYKGELVGGSNPSGASSGLYRVFRGGSWVGSIADCRSASRYRNAPSHRVNNLGFRVVVSQPVE